MNQISHGNMKKADKYILMVVCLFATVLLNLHFSMVSAAVKTDTIISEGNRYYMNREYDMAAKRYTEVIAGGFESGELYYNLGNAYYKMNKVAEAILNYEKALLFKPGDEDIRQNLALANARIIDKIDSIPDFFLKRWLKSIQGLLSPNQWAVLNIILFILALAGFALFVISNRITAKKTGFSLGVFFLIISVSGLMLMFARIQKIQQHDNAIIMVPSVNARSSPDEQSTNVFVLHLGTKVILTDSVQNWKEIRIANGSKGWVPGKALGEI
jgi:tetratricopeptide (TPR) repeat protein